ncbi:MAG: NAD-dependent epimerase/dehydratase family protein [Bacteroidales bacterium]
MRFLVTGALGFCGHHLVRRLANDPHVSVVGVDLQPTAPERLPLSGYYCCDVAAEGAIGAVVERVRPDGIFHLAGLFSAPMPALYRSNVMSAVELLDAVGRYAPDSGVVVVGSAAEYGRVAEDQLPITEAAPCAPVSAYGRVKRIVTEVALEYARQGLRVSVVRPFNIVGAGVPTSLVVGAMVDRIVKAVQRGEDEVRVGNLDCERDFVAVDDVVDAYATLMARGVWGEVFNICSGRPASVRSVVATLLSYAPRRLRFVVDASLCRADDVPVVYGSWARAHKAFGFTPATRLEHALRTAWEHAAQCGQ